MVYTKGLALQLKLTISMLGSDIPRNPVMFSYKPCGYVNMRK